MRRQVAESALAFRSDEPQECRSLQDEVEAERGLVGLFGIVTGLGRPLLDDEADGVLDRKGGTDMQ
jgi:hypothetical protein